MSGVREHPQVRVDLDEDAATTVIDVPPRAIAQALRSVITNAQDASPWDRAVVIGARRSRDNLHIEVRDRGRGMSQETLARLGEPFFTTKEPGHGMGLGLFLTRAVLDKLGGSISIESEPGQGTRVEVSVPVRDDRESRGMMEK
jgi:two-component system sensor histidine kinase RegB